MVIGGVIFMMRMDRNMISSILYGGEFYHEEAYLSSKRDKHASIRFLQPHLQRQYIEI